MPRYKHRPKRTHKEGEILRASLVRHIMEGRDLHKFCRSNDISYCWAVRILRNSGLVKRYMTEPEYAALLQRRQMKS